MEQQIQYIGVFAAIVLPFLLNLKLFARSSELDALKLWTLEKFAAKDDVKDLKDEIDKRFDAVDRNINEIKSILMTKGDH